MSNTENKDVCERATSRIIEQLLQGIIPWRHSMTHSGVPRNLFTGKVFQGANVWLLASLGYEQNYYLTFDQVKAMGGRVKKAEKSHMVTYWKNADKGNPQSKAELKYYLVFNIAQCEGIPKEKIPMVSIIDDPATECERILYMMRQFPETVHRDSVPYYDAMEDVINMPTINEFDDAEEYYSAFFPELIHWTGHESRLKRKEVTGIINHTDNPFTREQLVADMGAGYLRSCTGIRDNDHTDTVVYCEKLIEQFEQDKWLLIAASNGAQKAVDYILGEMADVEIINEDDKHLNGKVVASV